ncbi:hypothetical protein ARMSODRAFT_978616 [Armillaria solidipes]|uniref:Uncharacterized protein n=1 Tax=Armillaria solidipes TaxID=1076256 RepID=A0A2H3B2X4_9AGAR|nr:hypothetical protein ARMSODRAFT_978616 [Armillaria solidipes]
MSKDVWNDLYPNSRIELLPFILSARDRVGETNPSWSSLHDNVRELVAAYLDLEMTNVPLLQTIVLVTFLHELTYTLTKKLFRGRLGSLLDYPGILCDVGEYLEKIIFDGPLLYTKVTVTADHLRAKAHAWGTHEVMSHS